MTETLIALLLRLSEDGEPARLWGRLAQPHYGVGVAFDRLLKSRVIEEQARAENWPTCRHCDCGYDTRLIQEIDDKLIACCPRDAAADTVLEPDHLRRFSIDVRRLVASMDPIDPEATLLEPIPGLWRLGAIPNGRVVFLTLWRSVVEDPALLAVMQAGNHRDIALVAPRPSGQVLVRLEDARIRFASTTDALVMDGSGHLRLDTAALVRSTTGAVPTLVVHVSSSTVEIDGTPQHVPAQPFKLLVLLVRHALRQGPPATTYAIHRATNREPTDLVRNLRGALSRNRVNALEIRNWIQSKRGFGGYEINLAPDEIELRP